METGIYVDVLLVINYVISLLLIKCLAKCTGRNPKRRRIVAAALLGSVSSLTIFLPFMGFFTGILEKLALSALMVRVVFPFINIRAFLKEWFVFFAVNFFFAGVMLGLWMTLQPRGMLYYNGVVYFDVSSLTLIAATAIAYILLTLAHRFSRAGRIAQSFYNATIFYDGRSLRVTALVDSGNSLYEPFSDTPVIVCGFDDIAPLLPASAREAIFYGEYQNCGIPVRLIPYNATGGGGILPAIRADSVMLENGRERLRVENVYIGLSKGKIGGEGYNAILNPDLVGIKV